MALHAHIPCNTQGFTDSLTYLVEGGREKKREGERERERRDPIIRFTPQMFTIAGLS